ncbi:hypothetical protein DSO57_1001828 [Entomophthora muscae]|uniref:Uncharacterized protein n=1 Tax=Entomophthora muscae TaxID=34485 RepID=A0ACC2U756_9FUNG|nr:hypothetical protein DSO57_1001828 [Entomophthora muscae]
MPIYHSHERNSIPVLVSSFLLVGGVNLGNPTPTTDWYNSSPDDAHQKESLAHGWFKYPSGHWARKFQYGCSFTLPPAKPALVRPYASFYLLTYMVIYYILGQFSSMFGRFAYVGHLGHLAMVMVPISLVIAGLNLGALAHQLGNLFPAKWVPEILAPFSLVSQRLLLIKDIQGKSPRDLAPCCSNFWAATSSALSIVDPDLNSYFKVDPPYH